MQADFTWAQKLCQDGFVYHFMAKRWDHEHFRLPTDSSNHVAGFRAPGQVCLILQNGSGWLISENGERLPIEAKAVVLWEPGDWVEYETAGGSESEADIYWSADFTEVEALRRMGSR
jgi:hypothetical protein